MKSTCSLLNDVLRTLSSVLLAFSCLCCTASLAIHAQVAADPGVGSADLYPHTTLGGVTGLSSLADPTATRQLRDSGKIGLYIHAEGWRLLDDTTRAKILENFASTGPSVVELGYVSTPTGYFKDFFKPFFTDKGVISNTALVNGLCSEGTAGAIAYITAGGMYGLTIVAPVFAPNSSQFKTSQFSDHRWDSIRAAAQAGGALAVDAPPHVFFALKAPYQQFVIDELRWARQHKIKSYYIVSPNGSGSSFASEIDRLLDTLAVHDATPTNFVFETYDIHRTDDANQVGFEDQPDTITGVVLRLLPRLP